MRDRGARYKNSPRAAKKWGRVAGWRPPEQAGTGERWTGMTPTEFQQGAGP
jgi:hypothetical protein